MVDLDIFFYIDIAFQNIYSFYDVHIHCFLSFCISSLYFKWLVHEKQTVWISYIDYKKEVLFFI